MTNPPRDTAETWTAEQVVVELAEMVLVSRTSPTITQRLIGQTLVVLYEFTEPDGALRPYVMRVGGRQWGVEPGTVDQAEADIVIRTSPGTLHQLTTGTMGGREAIVSGKLDIRKAPSMPKLLMMRALFNRHRKARLRGDAGAAAAESAAERSVAGGAGSATDDSPATL